MAVCVQRFNNKVDDKDMDDSCDDEVGRYEDRFQLQSSDNVQHSIIVPSEQSNSLLMRVFSISVTAAVSIVIGSLIVSLGFVFSIVYCLCGQRDGAATAASSSSTLKRRSAAGRGLALTSGASASLFVANGSQPGSAIGVASTSAYKPFALQRPEQSGYIIQSSAAVSSNRSNRVSGEHRQHVRSERSSKHCSSVVYSCGHQRPRPLHLATPVLHAAKA